MHLFYHSKFSYSLTWNLTLGKRHASLATDFTHSNMLV